MPPHVHCSIIHNIQRMTTIKMSIYGQMNKGNVAYISSGILSNLIKSSITICDTWMNLKDIILSQMSETDRQILHDPTYMWNLKKGKFIKAELRGCYYSMKGGVKWKMLVKSSSYAEWINSGEIMYYMVIIV